MLKKRKIINMLSTVGAMVVAYVALKLAFPDAPVFAVQAGWTLIGLLGAIITGANLWDAIKDRRALDWSGRNGDLAYMANNAIRVEALRLSKMVTIVAIGILSLSAQPVLTEAQRHALHIPTWTTTSIIITAGLVWIVLGTMFQAALDRLVRFRFLGRG